MIASEIYCPLNNINFEFDFDGLTILIRYIAREHWMCSGSNPVLRSKVVGLKFELIQKSSVSSQYALLTKRRG